MRQRRKRRRMQQTTYLPERRLRNICVSLTAQSRASFARANCPLHASDELSVSDNQTCSICLMKSPLILVVYAHVVNKHSPIQGCNNSILTHEYYLLSAPVLTRFR
jgi:hypothetical protein